MQQSRKRPSPDAEGAKLLLRELTKSEGTLPAIEDRFGSQAVVDVLCLVQALLEGYVIQITPTESALYTLLERLPSCDRWKANTMPVRSTRKQDMVQVTFRKARVSMDHFKPSQEVEAYVSSQRWNGWAKPYFTFEQALELMKVMPQVTYDPEKDQFIAVLDDSGQEECRYEFSAETVEVDGQDIKVYPIGAGDWTWNT